MVRAPCCEKTGLKKGPWTSEEDQVLINYIHLHGHGNWRALPKLAGLLRCGKSCRLRWTNYLRPDIKRGNFSREEEDTIIQLHELLGNKWSAIAAKLPGRTDNEIKNVWHTHLKKKLPKKNSATGSSEEQSSMILSDSQADPSDSEKILDSVKFPTNNAGSENTMSLPDQHSSQRAHSDMSSSFNTNDDICKVQSPDYFPKLDDDFLTEVFSGGNDETSAELPVYDLESQLQFPLDSLRASDAFSGSSDVHEGNEMAFWNELYSKAGDFFEISDF